MEFSKTIFQAWKVIENNIGHGNVTEDVCKILEFFNNYFHKLLTVM